MKKSIQLTLLLFLSIISTACSTKNKEKNDLDTYDLNGKVKSLKNYSYEGYEESGIISKDKIIDYPIMLYVNFFASFNEDGYITEKIYYNDNKNVKKKTIYKYNLFGNLSKSCTYDKNGKLKEKVIYKYNLLGRRTAKLQYDSNGEQESITKYKYSFNGNKILKEYSSNTYHT